MDSDCPSSGDLEECLSESCPWIADLTDDDFYTLPNFETEGMFQQFCEETALASGRFLGLCDSKEFTYWLFKHRLEICDKARMASDTRKGLDMLKHMKGTQTRRP